MSIDKIKQRMRMIENNDFTTSGETNEIIGTTVALAAKALLAHKAVKKAQQHHQNNIQQTFGGSK